MGIVKKDPANFNPNVEIPSKVDSFRFWCQKVLPLVYDDSLSYYELLCKVVDYLNNIIDDVNTLGTDVDNLNNAFIKLQEYVNNYFSSLDVQEEINKKLDEMTNDGTFDKLISKFILGVINVKAIGAKGDGINDDTLYFQEAINTNQIIFIPNGTYNVSELHFNVERLQIIGETNTFINSNINWDLKDINDVYIKNITMTNGKIIIYSDYTNLRDKNMHLENVLNTSGTSWNLFISNKAPSKPYNERPIEDSLYSHYPIEIVNNSGYNSIMINNIQQNADGSQAIIPDNSAIGIIDKVLSSAPSFLLSQEGAIGRSFIRFKTKESLPKSSNNTIVEVNKNGHLAIGCECASNDQTSGAYSIKIRDTEGNGATLALYSENNKLPFLIRFKDGILNLFNRGYSILNVATKGISGVTNFVGSLGIGGNGFHLESSIKSDLYLDKSGRMRLYSRPLSAPSFQEYSGYEIANFVPSKNVDLPNLSTTQVGDFNTGATRFDTTNNKPVWWDSTKWIYADGTTAKSF